MTLDWKRFDDKVPTEPRSVIAVAYAHGVPCEAVVYSCFEASTWSSEQNGDTITIEVEAIGAAEHWRQEARDGRLVFWAYVDPPEEA